MHLDRKNLESLKEQVVNSVRDEERIILRAIGGMIRTTLFTAESHKHMLDHVLETWDRTGRCLEFDWCFGTVVYMVWSDILEMPVAIHVRECTPKEINKMVRNRQI